MPRRGTAELLPPFDWERYGGFMMPCYTNVPDDLFDWLMAYLTGAELKVILYIIRRTFGFKRDADSISQEQICHGILKEDGMRLDMGTGLARATVQDALRALREKGLIEVEARMHPKYGTQPSAYRLRMQGGRGPSLAGAGGLNNQAGGARPIEHTRNRVTRNSTPEGVYPQTPNGGGGGDPAIWAAVVADVLPLVANEAGRRHYRATGFLGASAGIWRVSVPSKTAAAWLKRSERLLAGVLPEGVRVEWVLTEGA